MQSSFGGATIGVGFWFKGGGFCFCLLFPFGSVVTGAGSGLGGVGGGTLLGGSGDERRGGAGGGTGSGVTTGAVLCGTGGGCGGVFICGGGSCNNKKNHFKVSYKRDKNVRFLPQILYLLTNNLVQLVF